MGRRSVIHISLTGDLNGRIARILGAISVVTLVASALIYLALKNIPLPDRLIVADSYVVEYSDGQAAHIFLAPDGRWRRPVDLDDVDLRYLAALLAIEDKNFYKHRGVDFAAIFRAGIQNALSGRVVSGASTLTMQLARLLEPRPRTLRSKVVEAFRAFQLEMHLSKRQILEAYLRFLPFGRNYESIGLASLALFGHPAKHLADHEIATLLAIPQAPARRGPSVNNRASLAKGRDRILGRLRSLGHFNKQDGGTYASRQKVPTEYRPLPKEAPHLATWLKAVYPNLSTVRTHLDRVLQRQLESRMAAFQASFQKKGVNNGVALIADHQTGQLKAAVGSFRFGEGLDSQIPGFDKRRSTGSTLKPFIYALALDRGLIIPSMVVPDVPADYGGYQPSNFDGKYNGLVGVENALSRSLNLPFVELLKSLGVPKLKRFLSEFELARFKDPGIDIGLTAAVGGVEMSPLELLEIYMSLPNDGLRIPLKIRVGSQSKKQKRVLSRPAAYLTRRAMTSSGRPDLNNLLRDQTIGREIHWKTGTSFGFRDAWAIGSTQRYTATVWLGNYNWRPSRHLVGRTAAGPILFDVLAPLIENHAPKPPVPNEIKTIQVCKATGYPAHSACAATIDAQIISGVHLAKSDPYLRNRLVDRSSGLSANASCRPLFELDTKVFFHASDLLRRYLPPQYAALPEPPPFLVGCSPNDPSEKVSIIHPPIDSEFLFINGLSKNRQRIPLRAKYLHQDVELDWFIDGVHIASVPAARTVWWTPTLGRHQALVMGPDGQKYSLDFTVR